MVKSPTVLKDLTTKPVNTPNRFSNKIAAILAGPDKDAEQTIDPESLPYHEPEIVSYIIKKGSYEGQRKFILQFKHKANPAWSRSYDLTDLELLVSALSDLSPALEELRKAPKLKKKA